MAASSRSVHAVDVSQDSCHQYLCHKDEPQSTSQPFLTCSGNSPRPADRSGPCFWQITSFALRSSVCENLCAPFKSEIAIFPNFMGLPKLSPANLESQMIWRLIFLTQAVESHMGISTFTNGGEPLQYSWNVLSIDN